MDQDIDSILNFWSPAGVFTLTSSSSFLPRIAAPTGDMSEILLLSGLASFAATTWYFMVLLLFSLLSSTHDPICTMSVDIRSASFMISADLIVDSSLDICACTIPWFSRAASSGAFSLTSPLAAAFSISSAMRKVSIRSPSSCSTISR